jgi:glycosyltransferase involved in cell wall biosynthesis
MGDDLDHLVVNDGSIDNTAEILAQYAQSLPLRIITHPLNRKTRNTFLTPSRNLEIVFTTMRPPTSTWL